MSDQFAQQGADTEYAESDVQATEADPSTAGSTLSWTLRPTAPWLTRRSMSPSIESVDESVDATDEPVDATDEVEVAQAAEQSDEDPVAAFKADLRSRFGDWFVVHSYAGYENRVKANLETRIQTLNMEDFIFEIEVPMEEVTEIKNGQKKLVRRVRMPGYVLVRMDLTDESWGAVRHTPGVTGFVGNAHQPVPLSIDEVFTMLAPEPRGPLPTPAAAAAQAAAPKHVARRRLRGRRVRHRHGGALRDPSRDDLRDQPRHPEAQGARLDLRPGDPGRAVLRPGRQDLNPRGSRAAPAPRVPESPRGSAVAST